LNASVGIGAGNFLTKGEWDDATRGEKKTYKPRPREIVAQAEPCLCEQILKKGVQFGKKSQNQPALLKERKKKNFIAWDKRTPVNTGQSPDFAIANAECDGDKKGISQGNKKKKRGGFA